MQKLVENFYVKSAGMWEQSTKVPVGERRPLADAILEHMPADLPMRAPQLTGFSKPKFPTRPATTSLADLANPDCWFGMHQLHIDP
ncbi:unnamed protein product [Pleuronectes platessa]|uniref:Uncharacterized protein n=1 Tax=Pleuronectes platessa TaxID=8262 RepID=A0A9N7UJ71_PLEPL|nr:unnamed protein product [Pleuronectes platessa]